MPQSRTRSTAVSYVSENCLKQTHNLKAAGSNPAPATIFIGSAKSSGDVAGAFSFASPES